MKQIIKNLHNNRVFTLIVWLIAVLIAIISAPNITNSIQQYNEPPLASNSQPIKAQKIRDNWGYNLKDTITMNLVYQNPNKKITNKQQQQITNKLASLIKHQSYYNIKKITTINTNLQGKPAMLSKDGSTEVATIQIAANGNSLRVLTDQLTEQAKIAGLKSYITSPQIVRDVNNAKIAQVTQISLIALFIAATLIIGIYLRSVLAALISFVVLFSSFVTTYSLSLHLASHFNWPFSEYSVLEIGIAILVIGTIWNIYILRRFGELLKNQPESHYSTKQTIADIRFPVTIVGLVLALIFACTSFINFSEVQSLYVLALAYVILILAVLTLMPVFMAALGESIFWPSVSTGKVGKSRYFEKAAAFSMWQPFASLLLVLYLTLPFIYFFNNRLDYSPMTNLTQQTQAIKGAQTLDAHFTPGMSTPVTVYIQSKTPLNNEKDLGTIDTLTTKLKSTNSVNSVYSLTQPGSMPIEKYYVANQLQAIAFDTKQATGQLTKASLGIKANAQNLDLANLQQQVKSMQAMVARSNSIVNRSSNLSNQVSQATSSVSPTERRSASRRIRQYQNRINSLNQELQSVQSGLNQLVTTGQAIQSFSQSNYTYLKNYREQIKEVNRQLKVANRSVVASNSQLNSIYDYLDGLQNSQAANVYFITKQQLQGNDFKQSLANFASQDQKTTMLQVVFNKTTDNGNNRKRVDQLQQQIKLQLKGTSLANANVAIDGEPVVESTVETKMNNNFVIFISVMIIGLLLSVFILSRAILQPLYWTAAFVASAFTGFQLAYITMHFIAHVDSFDWQVPIIAVAILTAMGSWQIISLGLSLRYTELPLLDWLIPTVKSYGTIVLYILLVVAAIAISLTFGASNALIEIALIVIYTTLAFYFVLPMIIVSLGKLAVTLPNKDNIIKNK
ncbi:MMPL family transporter [Lentilactobacillus sp. SPB1-3]|uniref:MMPL family transporter n=1 Tax=Lentilactobacillus terminaliae TaxID=3003483 RepID=A0ACD5DEQ7_9LACO|nr:MMPL family transporter [Lentilactobacillus sp. SPB1-3]MCZ0977510.1 MMPL family transporter [Lentilactobacillus sp. SPB1-3]